MKVRDVDNMRKGIRALMNGGLKKWSIKTTRSWGLREGASAELTNITRDSDSSGEEEEDMWDADVSQGETDLSSQMTFGIMHSKDGEMVVEYDGDDKNLDCDEAT